jgi:hypothetical protein
VAHYPFFAALTFAHRARCAAAILFLPAADIVRLGRAVLFCATFRSLVDVVGVPSNNRTTWLNLAISSFTSRMIFSIGLKVSSPVFAISKGKE